MHEYLLLLCSSSDISPLQTRKEKEKKKGVEACLEEVANHWKKNAGTVCYSYCYFFWVSYETRFENLQHIINPEDKGNATEPEKRDWDRSNIPLGNPPSEVIRTTSPLFFFLRLRTERHSEREWFTLKVDIGELQGQGARPMRGGLWPPGFYRVKKQEDVWVCNKSTISWIIRSHSSIIWGIAI